MNDEVGAITRDGWRFDNFTPVPAPKEFTGPDKAHVAEVLKWETLQEKERRPLFFFKKLFPRQLVARLAAATSARIHAIMPHAKGVDNTEMRGYLGIRLLMSLSPKRSIKKYWQTTAPRGCPGECHYVCAALLRCSRPASRRTHAAQRSWSA